MRLLLIFFMLVAVSEKAVAQSRISSVNVPKLEGGFQSLSDFDGKKMLFITLPLSRTNASDSLLYSLDTLAKIHFDSLQVIGVLSIEDGFRLTPTDSLLQWYRSRLNNKIVITGGIYTHKASGIQQHDLFKWLTYASYNEVFDIDANSSGYKFFCTAGGRLCAVLLPQTKLHGPSVQKVLSIK